MKKLCFIIGIILAIVVTACSNGQASDNQKNQPEKEQTVKVQWDANSSRSARASAKPESIKVHFYKVPIINGRYTYDEAVEIDAFEISEGDSLGRDYRKQVPEGYILGFSADNYVMISKANDGYTINGQEQECFFELRFETLENDIVLPSTLKGKSIDDEELYDLPATGWTYSETSGEGESKEVYFKNGNIRLGYFDHQAIVEIIADTGYGYLCYWFSQGTASDGEKTLAKNFLKERFGITDHID